MTTIDVGHTLKLLWDQLGPLLKLAAFVGGFLLLWGGIPQRLQRVEVTQAEMQSDLAEISALQRQSLKRTCQEMTGEERVNYDMAEACIAILRGIPYTAPDRTAGRSRR